MSLGKKFGVSMKSRFAWSALAIALLAALVPAAPAGALTGTAVSISSGPEWVVRFDNPGRCTGVLIDSEFFLTAAHCVLDDDGNLDNVGVVSVPSISTRGGRNNFNRSVNAVGSPILFNRNGLLRQQNNGDFVIANEANDIALVQIQPVTNQVAALASPLTQDTLTQYGFGRRIVLGENRVTTTALDTTLRQMEVDLVSTRANCDDRANLCTTPASSQQGACVGDSGGPVVTSRNGRDTVVGIFRGADQQVAVPCSRTNGTLQNAQITPAILDWAQRTIAAEACSQGTNGVPLNRVTVKMVAWGELATSGTDVLIGTNADDRISALAGNDVVCGRGGNDVLLGGKGADHLQGGDGNDLIRGNNGDDEIRGEAGNDVLYGNRNNDVIYAGSGADDLFGGRGQDDLAGEPSDDLDGGRNEADGCSNYLSHPGCERAFNLRD